MHLSNTCHVPRLRAQVRRVNNHPGLPLALILLALSTVAAPPPARADGLGPLPVRDFQPFHQLFLGLFGDRAAVIPKRALRIRVEVANTASVFDESSPHIKAQLKFETLRTGLFLRYGLMNRLEVGVEIPLLYRYSGVLEGLITATERAADQFNGPRERLNDVEYAFSVSRNGQSIFSGNSTAVGVGDISFFGKYQLLEERPSMPAFSVRAGVKAPTGDEKQLFGSGNPDVGIGVALEKSLATRWIAYANVNGVFPFGDLAGLALDPIFSTIGAVEYLWTPNVSLVLQLDYYTTPFSGTGTDLFDEDVFEVATGFNYRLRENLLWAVYGVEDLFVFGGGGAADFTLSTFVTYQFK